MKQKKLIVLLLCTCLMLFLAGCGGQEPASADPASSEPAKDTVVQEFQGLTYQVPSDWKLQINEEDSNVQYYYPTEQNTPLVMLQYTANQNGISVSVENDFILDAFIDGATKGIGDAEVLQKGHGNTAAGIPYAYTDFAGTAEGIYLKFSMALFNTDDGIAVFGLMTSPDSDTDCSEDFQQLVDSINKAQ